LREITQKRLIELSKRIVRPPSLYIKVFLCACSESRRDFSEMETAILRAHYDGEHIILDEPFELIANDLLMVTVVAPDVEHSEWAALGVQGLARAYSDDEPEYTIADIKPQ
jgi:hypothetical protein